MLGNILIWHQETKTEHLTKQVMGLGMQAGGGALA